MTTEKIIDGARRVLIACGILFVLLVALVIGLGVSGQLDDKPKTEPSPAARSAPPVAMARPEPEKVLAVAATALSGAISQCDASHKAALAAFSGNDGSDILQLVTVAASDCKRASFQIVQLPVPDLDPAARKIWQAAQAECFSGYAKRGDAYQTTIDSIGSTSGAEKAIRFVTDLAASDREIGKCNDGWKKLAAL